MAAVNLPPERGVWLRCPKGRIVTIVLEWLQPFALLPYLNIKVARVPNKLKLSCHCSGRTWLILWKCWFHGIVKMKRLKNVPSAVRATSGGVHS